MKLPVSKESPIYRESSHFNLGFDDSEPDSSSHRSERPLWLHYIHLQYGEGIVTQDFCGRL